MKPDICWMVFYGVDDSHCDVSNAVLYKTLKEAKSFYNSIDTTNWGSKKKKLVRLEFTVGEYTSFKLAQNVKIVECNF